MEGHFNRSYSYSKESSKVLPVILYLTLPAVNLIQTSKETTRKTRSRKQNQRDQERMKHYIEQKTVCSQFPFSSLDNIDIQNMVTQHVLDNFSKAKSKIENNKLSELRLKIIDLIH